MSILSLYHITAGEVMELAEAAESAQPAAEAQRR